MHDSVIAADMPVFFTAAILGLAFKRNARTYMCIALIFTDVCIYISVATTPALNSAPELCFLRARLYHRENCSAAMRRFI
jgi:hypothetical protein